MNCTGRNSIGGESELYRTELNGGESELYRTELNGGESELDRTEHVQVLVPCTSGLCPRFYTPFC